MLYRHHGGSGLGGLTYDNVMEMQFSDIMWWVEKLNEKREREAKQLSGEPSE